MNNNYFNIPNTNLMRNVPFSSVPPTRPVIPLPRFSSLFRNTPNAPINTGQKITFSGILNGASKTLGVINQAIPVFYQVKPIWKNAKTMFRIVKEINNTPSDNKTNTNQAQNEAKKEELSTPTFFV